MASVFLSYARTDSARAKRLAEALERAGHDVWWDRRIHGGAHYSKEIKSALERAHVVVVLWSSTSAESDWVQDEAAFGRDSGRLVPVAIEPIEPPLGFRQIQTLDLSRWRGRAAPPELLQAIEALAGGAESAAERPKPGAAATARLPRAAWVALAAIAALLALFGLWQLAGGRFGGEQETPTLAVLPFADLSPEGDKAYFSEGVGEAILSLLSREPGIKVIGRSSSAQFRPGTADFREIRKALGVTHFLEGSARTAGDQLRMSVRLIDARDGAQLWTEDYHRGLNNIFAVQDEIGRAVAERLKGTLAGVSTRQQTTAVDTYTLYLAMRAKMRGRDPEQLRQALDIARRINEADPSYAPGFAARAELIWLLSTENYGSVPGDTAFQRALPYARRAIQLAPDAAEGQAALGLLLLIRDPAAATQVLSRAMELDPSRAELRLWRAQSYVHSGRNSEALQDFRRVAEMEPLLPVGLVNLVSHLATAGRHSEAGKLIGDFQERGGSASFATWARGINAYLQGDLSEAVRHHVQARRLGLDTPQIEHFLSWAFHLVSLNASAEQMNVRQPPHSRLFVADRREQLLRQIAEAGPAIWQSTDVDVAIYALAAARDWPQLGRLYDRRGASLLPLCPDRAGGARPGTQRASGSIAINVAQALIATGRRDEALRLLDCVEDRLSLYSKGPVRKEGFSDAMIAFTRAQLLSLRGRPSEALRSLGSAVDHGWLGLYGANLRDYPAFDSLPAEELRPIQQKIDRRLAAERAEIQRFCPSCR